MSEFRLRSYVKVWHVGNSAIPNLFNDPVYVQEKVDGSQFSFGVMDGELQFRSKNVQVYMGTEVNGNFGPPTNALQEIAHLLHPNWTYRGEAIARPKHNALTYNRTPKYFTIVFDIQDENGNWLMPEQVKEECDRVGLEMVPSQLMDINSAEDVMHLLENESCLGGPKIEGVVFKNYKQMCTMKYDWPSFGKYVRPEFKELNKSNWNGTAGNRSKKDITDVLKDALRSEARWQKAIQYLNDMGILTNSPKDIGPLMQRIHQDIIEEESEWIKEKLFKEFWPRIKGGAVRGFPEWYKEELLKKQFNKGDTA